jgi:hypothetical protein
MHFLIGGYMDDLQSKLIWGFYEEEVPQFQQGGDPHELMELVTAKEVTEYVEAITNLRADLEAQKLALNSIFNACGFVENGTSQIVKLFQDDATKYWFFVVGNVALFAKGKSELIDQIVKAFSDADQP